MGISKPISNSGFIRDANNSTNTPLTASSVYTGAATDVSTYNQIHIAMKMSPNVNPDADANTAQGSFSVQFSPDGTNWDIQIPLFIRSGVFVPQTYIVVEKWFRVVYTNDGGASAITSLGLNETADTARNQTAFRLNVYLLATGTKELGRTIDQSISGSDPVSLTRSVNMGLTPSQGFINQPLGGEDDGSQTMTPLTNTTVGTFTVDAGTDVITLTDHGLNDGDDVVLKSSTTLPAGLAVDTQYFIITSTASTFQLAASSGGAAIDITDTGTGTHTCYTPGSFTGSWQKSEGFASMLPFAFGDEKLSIARLRWSNDGVVVRPGALGLSSLGTEQITGATGTFEVYISINTTIIDKYFRLEIVNGSDDQSIMETAVWMYDKPFTGSFAGLNSTLSSLSTALLSRAVIAGVKPDASFANVSLSDSGALQQSDYGLEVARGNLSDKTSVRKEGRTTNVTSTERVVWGSGTAYAFPTAASTVRIKTGGNAADTAAGLGAREITVEGLDNTGLEVSETIATNGATVSSATTATFQRINRCYVSQAGTYATGAIATGANTGVIQLETSGGVLLAVIAANLGRAASASYTIPLAKKGYFRRIRVTPEGNKAITIRLWSRDNFDDSTAPLSPKLLRAEWSAINDESGFRLDLPFELAAKTDIWATAKVSSGTQAASVAFELELVDDV